MTVKLVIFNEKSPIFAVRKSMRPPTLQYFYLQKPMTLLIIISILSVLLWIGLGEFYTKGEPREASVAVSMLEDNHWILPGVYANELAYKPPLTHWIVALFSLPSGEVTPFSSRLPSALAFIALIAFSFVFFGKNLRFQESFLAALIMLTAFELHRGAMTSRVDMLLTFFIVLGLQRLFRWEERKALKGFPFLICLILGLAALTKGPVGIVLPLLVFGVYLLFLKYNFWKIVAKLLPIALVATVFPLIWYLAAYSVGGKDFVDLFWAENFGRFFRLENLNVNYELGHSFPWWHNIIMIIAGFIPWTILLFMSLFGLNYSKKLPSLKSLWNSFLNQDKVKLFSLTAILVIFIFFCFPSSKRSVYLMPVYPFIAVFLAQYILFLVEYKIRLNRIFNLFIGILACITGFVILFTVIFPLIDPVPIIDVFTDHQRTLNDIRYMWDAMNGPKIVYVVLFCVLVFAIYILFKHIWRKNHLKSFYAVVGVYLALFLVMDGIFLPAFKNGITQKPFAEKLKAEYPLNRDNLFVMNNLKEYSNMYSLNFYLKNSFHNFETEQPKEGYFLSGSQSFEKVRERYPHYHFTLLEEYNNRTRDGERVIQFFFFNKIQ